MLDLIPRVKEVWEKQREEVLDSAEQISLSLRSLSEYRGTEVLGESIVKVAFEQLSQLLSLLNRSDMAFTAL